MGKVVVITAISIDGYVAGRDAGPANGLGDGGEALHEWYFAPEPDPYRDAALLCMGFP